MLLINKSRACSLKPGVPLKRAGREQPLEIAREGRYRATAWRAGAANARRQLISRLQAARRSFGSVHARGKQPDALQACFSTIERESEVRAESCSPSQMHRWLIRSRTCRSVLNSTGWIKEGGLSFGQKALHAWGDLPLLRRLREGLIDNN
jgi:hypothetical protein